MKYSIIVACYNHAATLPRLIEALDRQTFKDFDVHFCDDGSSDDTRAIIEGICASTHWVHHYQKNSGSYAKNLNQGIREATGDYCVFINGDSFPDVDYLEILNEYAQPNRIVCGIRIQMDDGVAVDLDWRLKKGSIPQEAVLLTDRPWARMTGNGLCVPYEAFRDYGLFDEHFKVNEGEDNELIARLFYKGYLCHSVPYLRLYHHWHKSRDTVADANSRSIKLITAYAG
jgi:glycosyltransferase involved in cell wall biosynthesis